MKLNVISLYFFRNRSLEIFIDSHFMEFNIRLRIWGIIAVKHLENYEYYTFLRLASQKT